MGIDADGLGAGIHLMDAEGKIGVLVGVSAKEGTVSRMHAEGRCHALVLVETPPTAVLCRLDMGLLTRVRRYSIGEAQMRCLR
jgi:hypothetical protein